MNNPSQGNSASPFSDIASKLSPFTQKISEGFYQARQLAEEKLGGGGEKTELPADYLLYETKVDHIKNYYINVIKISRTLIGGPQILPESLVGFGRTLMDKLELASGQQLHSDKNEEINEYHLLAKDAFQTASQIGIDDNVGTALTKFGSVQDRLGDCKRQMGFKINSHVINALNSQLRTDIDIVNKGRKRVHQFRLQLDSLKNKHKHVQKEKEALAREEIEKGENELVEEVEKTMKLMKGVIENPETIKCLAELTAAQSEFFTQAQQSLNEVASELDELQATQESLYRNEQNENE